MPTREKNSGCHFIQAQRAFKAVPNLPIFVNIVPANLATGRRSRSGASSGFTLDLEQFLKIVCSPCVVGHLIFFKGFLLFCGDSLLPFCQLHLSSVQSLFFLKKKIINNDKKKDDIAKLSYLI
jgi:hypothetical protein